MLAKILSNVGEVAMGIGEAWRRPQNTTGGDGDNMENLSANLWDAFQQGTWKIYKILAGDSHFLKEEKEVDRVEHLQKKGNISPILRLNAGAEHI